MSSDRKLQPLALKDHRDSSLPSDSSPQAAAKQDKRTMSYEEVKKWSEKFLLPSKVIYQLNSEFNCILKVLEDTKVEKEEN